MIGYSGDGGVVELTKGHPQRLRPLICKVHEPQQELFDSSETCGHGVLVRGGGNAVGSTATDRLSHMGVEEEELSGAHECVPEKALWVIDEPLYGLDG